MQHHGDDLYNYPNIQINFSSNIWTHADLSLLKEHLSKRLDLIRNYPEPEARSLEKILAERLGISQEEILVTNGATDAIRLIANNFSERNQVTLHPTFSEYPEKKGTGVLRWICNPNNPTGHSRPPAELIPPHDSDDLHVIDQAYEDYTLTPMLTDRDIVDRPNCILLHSMTKKYCIPGLRLGYLTAHRDLIARLRRNMVPWSVNALAIEAGKFLVTNDIHVLPEMAWLLKEAQRFRYLLNQIEGCEAQPTDTHFFLVRLSGHSARQVKEALAQRYGILVRDASTFKGIGPEYIRLATQLPEENDKLIRCLIQYLS